MKRIVIAVALVAATIMIGRSAVYRAAGEIRARQAEKPGVVKLRLKVRNLQMKLSDTLDAEVKGTELQKLHLPQGGEAKFRGCSLSDDFYGACIDADGRTWDVAGTAWM